MIGGRSSSWNNNVVCTWKQTWQEMSRSSVNNLEQITHRLDYTEWRAFTVVCLSCSNVYSAFWFCLCAWKPLSNGDARSTWLVFRHLGETAFPSKEQIESILDALSGTSTDGMTLDDLQERCNLRRGQIENALKFLAAEELPPIRRVRYT